MTRCDINKQCDNLSTSLPTSSSLPAPPTHLSVSSDLVPELFKLRVVQDLITVTVRHLHHLPGLGVGHPVSPGPGENLPQLRGADHPVAVQVEQLEGLVGNK